MTFRPLTTTPLTQIFFKGANVHKLFEYAVIKQEKRDKDDQVVDEAVIVVEPTTVLAKDEKQAELLANRAIPDEAMDDLDRLMVAVRPF